MRKLIVVACALAIGMLAGCGGGGGTAITTSAVSLSVPQGAAPVGVTPTAVAKSAAQLPAQPSGDAFVAGAQASPPSTTFTSPVTLTFTVATPVPQGATLRLCAYNGQGVLTPLIPAVIPTVSQDRMTLTVNVSNFSADGYFVILQLP